MLSVCLSVCLFKEEETWVFCFVLCFVFCVLCFVFWSLFGSINDDLGCQGQARKASTSSILLLLERCFPWLTLL